MTPALRPRIVAALALQPMTHKQLLQRKADLLAWAQSCLDVHDFHGLRDSAADLETISARIEERRRKR